MLIYDTETLENEQLENFKKFLDNEIGTEYEINTLDIYENNKYIKSMPTITIFDLTPNEVEKIRDFEKNHLNESYEKFCAIWKFEDDDTIYRSKFVDDFLEAEELHEEYSSMFLNNKKYDFRFEMSNLDKNYKDLLENAKEINCYHIKTTQKFNSNKELEKELIDNGYSIYKQADYLVVDCNLGRQIIKPKQNPIKESLAKQAYDNPYAKDYCEVPEVDTDSRFELDFSDKKILDELCDITDNFNIMIIENHKITNTNEIEKIFEENFNEHYSHLPTNIKKELKQETTEAMNTVKDFFLSKQKEYEVNNKSTRKNR